MAKPKPAFLDEVEAYKEELQAKAGAETDEDREIREKLEARARRAQSANRGGFGKRRT